MNDTTILAVDENLFGTIRFLEYSGHAVMRFNRGIGDERIHQQLQRHAQAQAVKVAFFTRDKDFLKYPDRGYFLYILTVQPMASQMEIARIIELALAQDFPGRADPQFEVTIRHVFRVVPKAGQIATGYRNGVIEVMSAVSPTPPHEDQPTGYRDKFGAWWEFSHVNTDLDKAGTGPPVAIFKCDDCQGVTSLGAINSPGAHHRTCPHIYRPEYVPWKD